MTVFIGALGIVVAILAVWFVVPFVLRKLEERRIRRVCRDQGLIVLTFDDGPCPATTPQILDILKHRGIKASFFALGEKLRKNPDIVPRILGEGHDLGHHSLAHLNAWKVLPHHALKDMVYGREASVEAGGSGRLFRSPYGKQTLLIFAYAKWHRILSCWWTVDPRDSLENPKPHAIILDEISTGNGGVVLLHDSDHYPCPDHLKYVTTLIEELATLASRQKLKFVTYSEMIEFTR